MISQRLFTFVDVWLAAYSLLTLLSLGLGFLPINRASLEIITTLGWLSLWLSPPLLLLALLRRQRAAVGLLLLCVLIWALAYLPKLLADEPSFDAAQPDTFTVLSYNIFVVESGKTQIAQQLRQLDADIVAIQELSSVVANHLAIALSDVYPYQALYPQDWGWHFRGTGILSKHPIQEDDYWQFVDLPETHGQQRTVITIDGQAIAFYNVHLWPAFALEAGQRVVFSRESAIAHTAGLAALTDRTLNEPLPVVLLGDFNMTPHFHEYRVLTQHFVDSHAAAGAGLGYTYPACGFGPIGAVVRIDYIFHSNDLESVASRVLDGCPPSDHHPVWARLMLPNSN